MGQWRAGKDHLTPRGVREGEGRELLKRCPQLQSGLGESLANAARRRSPLSPGMACLRGPAALCAWLGAALGRCGLSVKVVAGLSQLGPRSVTVPVAGGLRGSRPQTREVPHLVPPLTCGYLSVIDLIYMRL